MRERPALGNLTNVDFAKKMKTRRAEEGEAIELTVEDTKQMVQAIERIDAAMKNLAASGLSRKALVSLLADDTKLPKKQITQVLDSLGDLKRWAIQK